MLVAARHLLKALARSPPSGVSVDPTLSDELVGGRDLLDHWAENLPVFNVTPRVKGPTHRLGERFDAWLR